MDKKDNIKEQIPDKVNLREYEVLNSYESNKSFGTFEEYYEVDQLVKQIKDSFKNNVVLQFPNELLSEGFRLKDILSSLVKECNFYILCDNLKNSCCLDVVGASHLNYDLLVHFGTACFTEDIDLEAATVKYVLPKRSLDLEDFFSKSLGLLAKMQSLDTVIIMLDLPYEHVSKQIKDAWDDKVKDFKGSCLWTLVRTSASLEFFKKIHFISGWFFSDYLEEMPEKCELLFVGSKQSKILENLCLSQEKFNIKNIHVYDEGQLSDCKKENNSGLMKRFNIIQNAKKSNIFGILIGNPKVKHVKIICSRVKELLRKAKKKFYTFVLNNLSETKLNNFPEIDTFIIISCPFNSLFDTKVFYKTIITPFEFELLLDERQWGNYVLTDPTQVYVEELIRESENENQEAIEEKKPLSTEEQERMLKETLEEEKLDEESCTAVAKRDERDTVAVKEIFQSLDHFEKRTFKGIDNEQVVDVHLAKEGLKGIASQYHGEKTSGD